MLTKKALLVVFCSLVFPICPLLYGQATASFSGTVTDKTGSVVSGAAVKATAQATGLIRETKTDDSGHYLMPLLPIGDYTVRVDSAGLWTSRTAGRAPAGGRAPRAGFHPDARLGRIHGRSKRDRGGGADHEPELWVRSLPLNRSPTSP